MRAAAKVIFDFDHRTLSRRCISQLNDLSRIRMIVTDAKAPTELVNEPCAKGIEVIVASAP